MNRKPFIHDLFQQNKQGLGEHKLSLENIHGQSYDNASNMRGLKKGLQALLKTLIGIKTMYHVQTIPSTLLGEKAVSTYLKLLTILAFFRNCIFSSLDLHEDGGF